MRVLSGDDSLPKVRPIGGVERGEDQAEGLRLVKREEDSARVLPFKRRGPRTGGERITLAVTSGKGGVGKTQLAANLGVTLAEQGNRVLMLDADLGLASLDLALGLRPHDDLRAVVRGDASVEEVLVEGPCGVHLVPACPGRYDMANLTAPERQRLRTAVEQLADQYDILLIDTGAGIGSNAVSFASGADEVLLVVTPDPTSLRDAYAMAKVLHRRSGVDRIRVVANQVSGDTQGLEVHDRLAEVVRRFMTLDLDYLGCIPFHQDVRDGVARGEPYVLANPKGTAARALRSLARRVVPNPPPGVPTREVG